MSILDDYRHCWKGLHVYSNKKRQCPHCKLQKKVPTCNLPPHLKICRKGLHLYPKNQIGCEECNRVRAKEWYTNNPERHYSNVKKWIQNNPEKRQKASRDWFKNNRQKANEIAARRRTAKKSQTPFWANHKRIAEIYKKCPKGCHVDHIYPIISNYMCGLHVENNLQILTAEENRRKSNLVWPGQLDCQKGSIYDIFSKELTDLLSDQKN